MANEWDSRRDKMTTYDCKYLIGLFMVSVPEVVTGALMIHKFCLSVFLLFEKLEHMLLVMHYLGFPDCCAL